MDMDFNEKLNVIQAAADTYQQNSVECLAGALAESGFQLDQFERYGEWPDVSFGMYQQTVAFAAEGDHSQTAENVEYIRQLYNDPAYAANVAVNKFATYRASERNALDAWCRYNWPNRDPFLNPNRDNYARAIRKAQELWPATLAYNPRVDTQLQGVDWTCSVASLVTFLRTLGRDASERDLLAFMLPHGLVSQKDGLEDGRGFGVVQTAQSVLGEGSCQVLQNMSWDDALLHAGRRPLMIGGTNWYHWSYVKHVTSEGTALILGNPASSAVGVVGTLASKYWGDLMTFDGWSRFGPWNGVITTP